MVQSVLRSLQQWFQRWRIPENVGFSLTAILVGLLTGGMSLGFVWAIALARRLFSWVQSTTGAITPVLAIVTPALGGLLAGLVIRYVAPEVRGGGIPEVLRAIARHGSRIRARVVWARPLATALCIGSGGSAGRVGPIVQIGAALGSWVGQRARLTDERTRNLAACGAAAGIAATFNAPIAGVIFALEVILGEFTETYFATIVISAVSASVLSRSVLGSTVAFLVPEYALAQPAEIVLFLLLGTLTPGIAWLFTSMLYAAGDRFTHLKRIPEIWKPALGGLVLGGLGLGAPQVLGIGFDQIEAALQGTLALPLMTLLVLLKMVATSLTLGSGGSGGIFAPLLFVGAMFGGAYGLLLQGIFPGIELAPSGAYALVGMAAAFASAAHAPMTAMLIAFEMSGSYTLILPLMLATGVGTVLSRTLRRESIYTLPLAREGVTPAPGQALDVLQNVRIDDVMTVAVVAVSLETTLADLWALVEKTRHRGYPVLDTEGRLVGIVSLGDVQGAQTRWPDWESRQVGDICTRRLVTAFPDESVSVALQRLGIHDLSRLPVVDRDDPRILLGLIHLSHIGEAYRQVMDSQHELRFAGRTLHPASSQGAGVFELAVGAGSRLVGKAIREYPWPAECWVVTLVRDGKVLAARGDTVIHRGDRLVFYAREADVNALQEGARASHDV